MFVFMHRLGDIGNVLGGENAAKMYLVGLIYGITCLSFQKNILAW